MTKKRIKRRIVYGFMATLLLALIIWTAWENTALQLNAVIVSGTDLPEAFNGYRIAYVSDLHNAEMGEENQKLLTLLAEAEPDMIAITGDLIDSRNTHVDIALQFAEQAVKIAPCYYITGNHEARVIEDFERLKAGLTACGVTVLSDTAVSLEKNGAAISLIGMNDPDFTPSEHSAERVNTKLQELIPANTSYTLLLSHRPELFDTYVSNSVDLVLSGHAHGGQFRLPFVGGLFAPHQGFFPAYDSGLYTANNTHMVVSRGIGNSLFPFRFNNRPEVIVVTLTKTGL